MQLFLSGADLANYPSSPSKSLGGWISSSPLRNDDINNLFEDISILDIEQKTKQIKGLFLKNTTNATISNPNISIKTLPGYKIELATVVPGENGTYIEKIENSQQSPIYAQFVGFNVTYSSCILTILTPSVGVENLELLGEDLVTDNSIVTIEDLVDFIVTQFEYNTSYKITKTESNKFKVESLNKIPTTTLVNLISDGNATSDSQNLSGGVNNSQTINISLDANETLGMWLKLTPINPSSKSFNQLYDEELQYREISDKFEKGENLSPSEEIILEQKNNGVNLDIELTISW